MKISTTQATRRPELWRRPATLFVAAGIAAIVVIAGTMTLLTVTRPTDFITATTDGSGSTDERTSADDQLPTLAVPDSTDQTTDAPPVTEVLPDPNSGVGPLLPGVPAPRPSPFIAPRSPAAPPASGQTPVSPTTPVADPSPSPADPSPSPDPTDPPAEPTDPPVDPTDPPTDPPVDPGPTDPPTDPGPTDPSPTDPVPTVPPTEPAPTEPPVLGGLIGALLAPLFG